MPTAISAYSIAVAPLSLAQKRRNCCPVVSQSACSLVMRTFRFLLAPAARHSSVIRCETSGSSAGGIV